MTTIDAKLAVVCALLAESKSANETANLIVIYERLKRQREELILAGAPPTKKDDGRIRPERD